MRVFLGQINATDIADVMKVESFFTTLVQKCSNASFGDFSPRFFHVFDIFAHCTLCVLYRVLRLWFSVSFGFCLALRASSRKGPLASGFSVEDLV